MGAAVMTAAVGGLAVMGDPFPISRVGVVAGPDGLVIVNAVCPGERLTDVRIGEHTDDGPYREVWHIRGDAPLPARLQLGAAPVGFETVTEYEAQPDDTAPLSLSVVTNELRSPYSMDFELGDVPTTGVLSYDEVFPTIAEFERATVGSTPCGDPYSERRSQRVLRTALIVTALAGASGVTLLVFSRRRKPLP